MPRGGHRPGAGRPKGAKNKKSGIHHTYQRASESDDKLLPLDYMLKILRDENVDDDRRDKIAYWLLPYLHPKPGVKTGKKEEREERAKQAGTGRFSASSPPELKAVK